MSFILLSITHFHSSGLNNPYKAIQFTGASSSKTVIDSENDCPVCHLFASVNFSPAQTFVVHGLKAESKISLADETGLQTVFGNSQCLRAPPSLISL
jgi:hypothetical protein